MIEKDDRKDDRKRVKRMTTFHAFSARWLPITIVK